MNSLRLTGHRREKTVVSIERIKQGFIKLVSIDAESKDERKIGNVLKELLESFELEVYEDQAGKDIGGTTGNIIAVLEENSSGIPIFFAAHLDRAKPGKGIIPVEKGGKFYSSGDTVLAADDIAGIVGILETLTVIKEKQIPHGRIEVVLTVAEEIGLLGVKNLDFSAISADFGFVLDSGGEIGSIVIKGPAQYDINAVVIGSLIDCGSDTGDGANAIKAVSEAIALMPLDRIDNETIAKIKTIREGQGSGIAPGCIKIKGEVRSHNQTKLDRQIITMQNAIEQSAFKYHAHTEISISKAYSSFSLTEKDLPVKFAVEAAKKIGIQPICIVSDGGSDANIFNEKGKTAVNISVGYEKAHSTEECIEIQRLIKLVEYLLSIVREATNY